MAVRVYACLLALVVLIALAAPARADLDLDAEVERLVGPDATQRSAAYSALQRAKDPAIVARLVKRLPAAEDMAQYYGVLLIQQHPKEGRPALWKLVKAPSTHLRVVAGAALCRMGESKAASVVAKALTDEGVAETNRATLLMRIYSVRAAEVQAAVRDFLQVDGPYQVVQAAIYNVYLVRDKQALAPLRALDEHVQPGVRAMAGACRMLLGDPDGVATTTQAFEEGGIDTSAIYKVKSLLEQARPVPPSLLDAVHAAMDDETNAYALRTMIEILGAHGHAKAAKAIRELLEHTDGNVSKAAFEALSRFPGGVSPETMRALLAGGDDGRRLAAAEALRRADDPSGFAVVVEVLRKGSTIQHRYDAARALANFRRPESVPPLLEALDDANSTVRSNAYNSLGSVLRALYPYRRFDIGATGYSATGPAAKRAAASKRLRAWWAQYGKADW